MRYQPAHVNNTGNLQCEAGSELIHMAASVGDGEAILVEMEPLLRHQCLPRFGTFETGLTSWQHIVLTTLEEPRRLDTISA